MTATLANLHNGASVPIDHVSTLPLEQFREQVLQAVESGARIAALFACPLAGTMRLFALLASRSRGSLAAVSTQMADEYLALTPNCPQAHLFEREIAEQWRIRPVGHPWLKPVRFEQPVRAGADLWPNHSNPTCGVTNYFQVTGDEIHEVAVGPVHAGIIEPGHFRFQCFGETVYHLEISLGYQHRGIEKSLVGGPDRRTPHFIQTLAGDTTIGHTMAYCRAIESLTSCRVPPRAQVLRGIALELERMANHIGDLGALAGDVGFLPTMSYCGRIRGDVLNLTATLCGNRFGRGLLVPGGVAFDLDQPALQNIRTRLSVIMCDAQSAVDLLWQTPSVMSRFEGTGVLSPETAAEIGLVGVAARACGIDMDVRRDWPYGIYRFAHIPVVTGQTGDVFARAFVRWLEVQRSAAFILEQLDAMPDGPIATAPGPLAARQFVATLVEGWRGEICHVAITDDAGRFARYKVVDPSFHNWFGLAMALRHQQISDFPLCNKSFNLSYCGHDL